MFLDLEPEDELFLTLMKLGHNFHYQDVAIQFGIGKSTSSNVFITWINLLCNVFKEINTWPTQATISNYEKFKGNDSDCTVIIDCTEFKIEKPTNPVSEQLTWSSYKNCNTVKVLVGISPNGGVTFISDAMGGSVSDRQIFEKCGIIILQYNDVILCDRGFNVQDLVAHKNVKASMPSFIKKGMNQLKPEQMKQSKRISSKRIHVERMMELGKTYEILNNQICTQLIKLAGHIVFVCFMLANLRLNIVHPL